MRNPDIPIPVHHLNVGYVNAATERARDDVDVVVRRAMRALSDPEREKRMAQHLCTSCFYVHRSQLAGQAFTNWRCYGCQEVQPAWPNTATPKLCAGCAESIQACVRCTADLELRVRVKLHVKGRTSRKRR